MTMDLDKDQCLDYVFVKTAEMAPTSVRATAARLVGVHAAPHDRTLYPSDHFGVLTDLQL